MCGAATATEKAPSEASAITVSPRNINRAVGALDALTNALMRKTGVPGVAIAVVHDDKVVYIKGFGVRRVGATRKIDVNTVFQLASVSKPVGAAVIAGAITRGYVKWDDPVAKYLPGFTLSDSYVGRTVTIADMYAHRSGLPDHAGDLLEDLGFDRATILQRLALEPLKPFRVTYNYTNFGITAAAQAVANAAHESWEDLSRDLLYRPLGLRSTSSRHADYRNASDRAALHVRVGTKWEAKFDRDPDPESPAGGVSSSIHDMAQWLRFELDNGVYNGKRIVNESALLATRTPNLMSSPLASPNSRASFYGLGIGVSYDEGGRLRLSHSGGFALGAATTILMLPSEKLGIVVLTNGMPIGVPEAIAQEFFDIAEFGSVQRDWYAGYSGIFARSYVDTGKLAGKARPLREVPAHPLQSYTGTCQNAYYGPAKIVMEGHRLVLVLGPHDSRFPLTHWSADTFSYRRVGENALGITAVDFTVSGNRATQFTVEELNANKLGTFSRT